MIIPNVRKCIPSKLREPKVVKNRGHFTNKRPFKYKSTVKEVSNEAVLKDISRKIWKRYSS